MTDMKHWKHVDQSNSLLCPIQTLVAHWRFELILPKEACSPAVRPNDSFRIICRSQCVKYHQRLIVSCCVRLCICIYGVRMIQELTKRWEFDELKWMTCEEFGDD